MSNAKKSKVFKDRLKAARLPERSVPVCLRGDLIAEHERLERDLKEMRRQTSRSLGDNGEEVVLAERIAALEAEMAEETEEFLIRALPRHDWDALVAKHPHDPDDPKATLDGVNLQALMEEAIPLCTVSPELDVSDWSELSAVSSSKTFDNLADAVWQVNRGTSDVPFSLLASRVIQRAAGEQKQPEPTA